MMPDFIPLLVEEPQELQKCVVLIVSLLHQRRQSLRALLNSVAEGEECMTTGYENAWEVIEEKHPRVVVVDNWFSNHDAAELLKKIKQNYPRMRCIVLDDAFQGGYAPILKLADVVLESDMPTSRLMEAVRQQLNIWRRRGRHPKGKE